MSNNKNLNPNGLKIKKFFFLHNSSSPGRGRRSTVGKFSGSMINDVAKDA